MDKNDKKIEKDKNKEEIVHLKQKIGDLENQVKRVLADYQNLEKRTAEEKRALIINASKNLLLRLLPVLDTLMLASNHVKDQGLTLSVQQFLKVLEQEGVKPIGPTKNSKFNPSLMECIEVAEGEDGRVIAEVLPGYLLNDKVLRPTMVKVGSAKQNEEIKEAN